MVGREGFEPSNPAMSRLHDARFWDSYNDYLVKTSSKDTASDRIQYGKKYYYVLVTSNAEDLLSLSNEKRLHVMKALTKLSKYLGQYQEWIKIKERYQLKWSQEDSLSIFKNIIDGKNNYQSMTNWVRKVCRILPKDYANIIMYCTLTGLRPSEACESIRLIHTQCDSYFNKKDMVLEHFKYPEIFIRKTKKEYMSIVSPKIVKIAYESKVISYDGMKNAIRKYGVTMNMAYCRKIFATYLRINGIEQEIIDLLQGRVPKSIFVRHYYRPEIIGIQNNRINTILAKLYKILEN
jgi:intergrase/recombinase